MEFVSYPNLHLPQVSFMLMRFVAGCGKSVLTSSLIDRVLSAAGCSDYHNTSAFYYCDHADKRTLEAVNIFSGLAQQLLRSMADIPPVISSLIDNLYSNGSQTPGVESIIHLLLEMIKKNSQITTFFLDGLDEVLDKERNFIFLTLQKFLAMSEKLKIFVSSREDTTYLIGESSVPNFKVRLDVNCISGDIDNYARHAIRDLIQRGELVLGNLELEEEIFTALTIGAKGM